MDGQMGGRMNRRTDRPMDAEIPPHYRSILTDRLDYLSRAPRSESKQDNQLLGTEPPGRLELEVLGSSPEFSPAGQTLHCSEQQPRLSICCLDHTGSQDTSTVAWSLGETFCESFHLYK